MSFRKKRYFNTTFETRHRMKRNVRFEPNWWRGNEDPFFDNRLTVDRTDITIDDTTITVDRTRTGSASSTSTDRYNSGANYDEGADYDN